MLVLLCIACKPVKKSLFHFGNQSPPLTILPSLPPVVFFSPGINFSRPVCLKCWSALGSSRELIKASVTGLLSQSLWCSRFKDRVQVCNSNKFPGNADSWGPSVGSTAPKTLIGLLYTVSFHLLPHLQQPELQLHHHWYPHVEFTGHCVSETPVTLLTQPCLFSLIWLPRHHSLLASHYLLLSACSFWVALTEILFGEALPLTAGFHSFSEHCPCLLLFSIYILPEMPVPCLKLLLACQ